MVSRRKLVIDSMILTILLVFALQIYMFGISVSSKRNVSGTVYASSGVPLSSVAVYASGSEGSGYATTDLNGHYLMSEGLKTGNYTVSTIKEGYLGSETKDVMVTAGSETTGVNLYLSLSGGIKGKVKDSVTSISISNIAVFASLSNGSSSYGGYALTDIVGNYQIDTDLGAGTYNVSVLMPTGYVSKTVSPVTVTAGTWTTGVDLALDQSGIISGMITAFPGGQPLANVSVIASTSDFLYFGTNQTDVTGHYRIASGLGTGTYTVMATYDAAMPNITESVNVIAHQETSNVNMQLTVIAPPPHFSGTVKGKVTDAGTGNPIQDADVTAVGDTYFDSGSDFTDINGNYVISQGLEHDDTYIVTASASGYQDSNVTGVNVVVNQTTQNVNLQLTKIPPAQSGSISGTVTGDTNPLPEFEYPIAIMLVLTLVAVVVARMSDHRIKNRVN